MISALARDLPLVIGVSGAVGVEGAGADEVVGTVDALPNAVRKQKSPLAL